MSVCYIARDRVGVEYMVMGLLLSSCFPMGFPETKSMSSSNCQLNIFSEMLWQDSGLGNKTQGTLTDHYRQLLTITYCSKKTTWVSVSLYPIDQEPHQKRIWKIVHC